ncbi:hypothetical protein LUZ61_020513 [Rhynchospora tenuis]|uniref:Uncharacterized protein n=1 Tax=Rhynchospora tenuis TaxID=198213 RepID=A0AAD5ZDJ9_9POAL|nr:hypothetical protein LUZ61_020513 [Rhynchospora tenuis]
MDIPPETEEYIRESIECSLGLQISAKNMQLKLLASEDSRHRLQSQVFHLEDCLRKATRQIDLYKRPSVLKTYFEDCLCKATRKIEIYKSEASMNAKALKKCVEEKEAVSTRFDQLTAHCAKLERECSLYERDLERLMDSLDEAAKENEELRARAVDHSQVAELTTQIDSLQKDKENLLVNLSRAEEEVNALFEENKLLEESNKKLLYLLEKERLQRSDRKNSPNASATGKRKSRLTEGSPTGKAIDFSAGIDPTRPPLSPLRQNSPESRMHKK